MGGGRGPKVRELLYVRKWSVLERLCWGSYRDDVRSNFADLVHSRVLPDHGGVVLQHLVLCLMVEDLGRVVGYQDF